jgi:serine/threonine-protein kinase
MIRHASSLPSQIGRYQVVRAIGRGAMGQVLLAHDPVLGRPVAVKHLRDDLALTAEQVGALGKRMEQEAKAAARVSHPNLVALHDMGRDPIVGLFLVFEYIEGETLEQRLRRGPLPAADAARLSRELGGALSEAHAAQVLHRDVKPENVLLARTGAKVADFGIARLPDSTLTRPGALLGTPAYSAPEAIELGSFSPQSDQFSMACTLFEAISARRAFPGDDAAMVAALVQTTEPAELARLFRLDPRVDTVLARAFSKHPSSRFPSCAEFGEALADALSSQARASLITQPDGYHRALATPHRRRAGSVAGAVLLGLALVASVLLLYQSGWRVSVARGNALARPLVSAAPPGTQGSGAPGATASGDAAAGSAAAADPELAPVAWLYERPGPRAKGGRSAAAQGKTPARSRSGADAGTGER